MSRKRISIFCVLLTLVLLVSGSTIGTIAIADDSLNSNTAEQVSRLPSPEELDKTGVPDSNPMGNVLNPDSPLYGKVPIPHDRSLDTKGDQNFGTRITELSSVPSNVGAYAMLKVSSTMDMSITDKWLYAPNLMSPNGSALEVFVAYYEPNGQSTHRYWCVWDHVNGQTIHQETIDATFMSKYTSSGFTQSIVQKYNNGWRVYLWDYQTSQWEQKEILSGTSNNTDGWCIFEAKDFLNDDPSLQTIEAKSIQVYTTQGWEFVTSSWGSEIDVAMDPDWDTSWINQYYRWTVSP